MLSHQVFTKPGGKYCCPPLQMSKLRFRYQFPGPRSHKSERAVWAQV